MKKLAVFLCAVVAVVAGVAYTPAFSASATDIVLTPEQTRALFSDRLTATYFDGATYQTAYFTFFDYGIIDSKSYQPDREYDVVGDACVIYKLDNANIIDSVPGDFALRVNPIFDISGLDFFRMSCGVSYAFGVHDVYPGRGIYFDTSSNITNSYWSYYSDYRNSDTVPVIVKNYFNYYSTYGDSYGYAVKVKPTNYDGLIDCSIYQTSIYNHDKYFTVFADTASETGILQRARVEKNVSIYSDVNDAYFVYLTCPDLTSDYVASDPPNWESSGGGSESSMGGYDGPDYSEQLALILAKLDLIVNNDFNFDVDLSADLAGLESRLDGVNSRLDGNNSRLDGNNSRLDGANSRLDGANSRLDGVNSRLDNISAELHDLNSAPNESLPDTGGENSEFDRQAHMYMSDIRGEFEDSENQVFEVAEKGTGFLGFVRDILVTSHFAQILPLLALLYIAHYVIFERGG